MTREMKRPARGQDRDGAEVRQTQAKAVEPGRGNYPAEIRKSQLSRGGRSKTSTGKQKVQKRQTNAEIRLWATAFHEAGHAAAAWRLGIKVKCASIVPTEEILGYVEYAQRMPASERARPAAACSWRRMLSWRWPAMRRSSSTATALASTFG
jgi:hypothetical protein